MIYDDKIICDVILFTLVMQIHVFIFFTVVFVRFYSFFFGGGHFPSNSVPQLNTEVSKEKKYGT